MTTGVQAWSKTAANNATADSAVNWAEGMAPSAVNDSARAEMASVAKWRDDFNGSITTGGSSTAYTITTNQTMTALVNSLLAFVPHTTNGATVTLATDSIGAKPLRSAPGVELPAGVLVQGTPYTAVYYTTNSGEWILQGFYGNPYGTPVGGFMPYVSNTPPNSSFVLPYGQAISRTTYASLFLLTSTIFGAGDGSTTFNVPDLRGRTVFGLDNMGGSAASRITGSGSGISGTTVGATGGTQATAILRSDLPNVAPAFTGNLISGLKATADQIVLTGAADGGQDGSAPTTGVNWKALARQSTVDNFTPSGSISSINGNVAQTSMATISPAIILPYILRVI